MSRQDKLAALGWFAIAVAISLQSLRLPLGTLKDPGAGFFPFWSGVILGGLSLLGYFRSSVVTGEESSVLREVRERWPKLTLVILALVGYAVGLELLGFLLVTFGFLLLLFRTIEPVRWSIALPGSALFSVAVYTLLKVWLGVQLPGGLLAF